MRCRMIGHIWSLTGQGLRLCSWRWFFRSGCQGSSAARARGLGRHVQERCGKSRDNIVDLQFWDGFWKLFSGKTRDGLTILFRMLLTIVSLMERSENCRTGLRTLGGTEVVFTVDKCRSLLRMLLLLWRSMKWAMWWWPTVACISSWGLNDAPYSDSRDRPGGCTWCQRNHWPERFWGG